MKSVPFDTEFKEMPFRDPTCKSYFQCLTLAAHNNKQLDCTGCKRYVKAEREEVVEMLPFAKLLYALFFSDKTSRGSVGMKSRQGQGRYVRVKERI